MIKKNSFDKTFFKIYKIQTKILEINDFIMIHCRFTVIENFKFKNSFNNLIKSYDHNNKFSADVKLLKVINLLIGVLTNLIHLISKVKFREIGIKRCKMWSHAVLWRQFRSYI